MHEIISTSLEGVWIKGIGCIQDEPLLQAGKSITLNWTEQHLNMPNANITQILNSQHWCKFNELVGVLLGRIHALLGPVCFTRRHKILICKHFTYTFSSQSSPFQPILGRILWIEESPRMLSGCFGVSELMLHVGVTYLMQFSSFIIQRPYTQHTVCMEASMHTCYGAHLYSHFNLLCHGDFSSLCCVDGWAF